MLEKLPANRVEMSVPISLPTGAEVLAEAELASFLTTKQLFLNILHSKFVLIVCLLNKV
jgi:hypothetical protein